jgi:hypothetical protein
MYPTKSMWFKIQYVKGNPRVHEAQQTMSSHTNSYQETKSPGGEGVSTKHWIKKIFNNWSWNMFYTTFLYIKPFIITATEDNSSYNFNLI